MDHLEVAVEGQDGQEGDAGSSVEEQHEEHGLAHGPVAAAPHTMLVVVGLEWKAYNEQEISHHDVEEEDTVGPPELEPEQETKVAF